MTASPPFGADKEARVMTSITDPRILFMILIAVHGYLSCQPAAVPCK